MEQQEGISMNKAERRLCIDLTKALEGLELRVSGGGGGEREREREREYRKSTR